MRARRPAFHGAGPVEPVAIGHELANRDADDVTHANPVADGDPIGDAGPGHAHSRPRDAGANA